MSKKVVVSADVHNLSETSDDDDIPPAQPKKKRCPKTEETSQEPSNSEILQMLLLQNQTLLKLVEKGCSPALTVLKPRFKTTRKTADEEIDLDAPVKFSTSRAATWKSRVTYSGRQTEVNQRPWYEPISVTVSVTIFLVYFCYLREENDVDTKFSKTLYDHISGLEEQQLKLSLEYNASTGGDTEAIKERLAELEQAKIQETLPKSNEKSVS